ncbi:MAG: hypothetical protein SAK29_13515 [Scytonema sp. PMC 1069.18]|nr:hypothetical protein [Scytonema sp. PMC 1069.18]MEC4879787.1 hypothetical protein [Scytonema sp. PMC 1070.18]
MTNAQPPNVEERLSRLENLFANIGETVLAQNDTIDVLVANVQQLTENVNAVTNRVDILAIQAEQDRQQAAVDRQTFHERMDALASEAAQDRAQAAQDRQLAAIDRQEFRTEIRRIWEYLRDRNGGSSPPRG